MYLVTEAVRYVRTGDSSLQLDHCYKMPMTLQSCALFLCAGKANLKKQQEWYLIQSLPLFDFNPSEADVVKGISMKNPLKFVALIVVVAVSALLLKEPIKQTVYKIVTYDMFVSNDEDSFDPGPKVGTQMPAINGIFNGKKITDIDQFAGSKGTIFIASRSFDWCPYCMRQLIQLQHNKALFDEAGIGLVAMTYDSPELQQAFIDKHGIDIPVLSDNDAKSFKSLDILHADYENTDEHYGLPYPGMIILNTDGIIVGKLFIEAYSQRVDAESSLKYALSKLE